jgi:branched-chain amino acid transport system permease protein
MKDLRFISLFAIVFGCLPFATHSGVLLNLLMMALFASLMSQAWNILGGFGGQLSFGHALFFGTGAYAQAIFQIQYGVNPWLALLLAICISSLLGGIIGWISFRYGLKGSYFALITLAFAEVFRILSLSSSMTGAGVGLMLALSESFGNMQFSSKTGYIELILTLNVAALLITLGLKNSRMGAYLQAVRDNEDAAKALGVNPLKVKFFAISMSGALMGAAGCFYVQVFQYIDPNLAYGAHTSVAALVGAIVGGMGTLWGPVLGAFALELLSTLTRNLLGELPGINMVVYGGVLILIIMFLPKGLMGLFSSLGSKSRASGGIAVDPNMKS